MTAIKGNRALLDALRVEGVKYIFGTPGATEVPWLDILSEYDDIKYIVVLHEAIAVAMADGYAQASGRPALASVHATPGVGHVIGNLHNAHVSGIPIIILAGQTDSRMHIREPFLTSDLLQPVRQYTKWCWEVNRAEDIPFAIHRAFKLATDPPTGPTMVAIPRNLHDHEFELQWPIPTRNCSPQRMGSGDSGQIARAAELLVSASRPALLCGEGARSSGAIPWIIELVEKAGLRVYGGRLSVSNKIFPSGHPHYMGILPPQAETPCDLFIVIGHKMFLESSYETLPFVPPTARLVHIDANPREIAKNYAIEVGIIGDPKLCVQQLLQEIEGLVNKNKDRIASRMKEIKQERDRLDSLGRKQLEENWDRRPISAQRLAGELQQALGPDAIFVIEAVTFMRYFDRHYELSAQGAVYQTQGGCLGWGVPAGLGVKLANPDKTVVALVGDGSFMFYPQALWTSVKYGIPLVTVVCNNFAYMTDKILLSSRHGPAYQKGDYSTVDITSPNVDFVKYAEAVGAWGIKVEEPEALRGALQSALSCGRPAVVDVHLDPRQPLADNILR